METRTGKFIVARPAIEVGFFKHSVVFIYEDKPLGHTAGLCLTHRTHMTFGTVASQFGLQAQTQDDYLYKGGPVNENSLLMLHTPDFESTNTLWTEANICVSSDTHMVNKLSQGAWPRQYRLVTGVSIWAPGQLDSELARNSWLVCDLPSDMVFSLEGQTLWNAAIDLYSNNLFSQYI